MTFHLILQHARINIDLKRIKMETITFPDIPNSKNTGVNRGPDTDGSNRPDGEATGFGADHAETQAVEIGARETKHDSDTDAESSAVRHETLPPIDSGDRYIIFNGALFTR
jgi:hypothetical protein